MVGSGSCGTSDGKKPVQTILCCCVVVVLNFINIFFINCRVDAITIKAEE